jgi:hypothetical protein
MRGWLNYANVMVTLLGFVVLGGAAYAAFELPKNSVRSANIVNDQVRGADVKESSLGHVPAAANGARRIDFQHASNDPEIGADAPGKHVLLHHHAVKLTASCFETGADTAIEVTVTSSKPAYVNHHGVRQTPSTVDPRINGRLLSAGDSYSSIRNDTASAGSVNEDQVMVVRTPKSTLTATFHTEVNDSSTAVGPECVVEGTAVAATD